MLDTRPYPSKIKVTDTQMKIIHLIPDSLHGDWNYAIHPNTK